MKSDEVVFITGATGLVGGLLALRALAAGCRLRLLARGGDGISAAERIRQVFLLLGMSGDEWDSVHDCIEVVQGDVAKPRFGLTAEGWQQAAENVKAVYHAAAYTGFDTSQAEKSVAVNLDGTRNMLKFVEEARARYFHVSTAYIAGNTQERIFEEELHGRYHWKNPYEKTKFLAEQEVHGFCRQKRIDYTVFRPAILIGDSRDGRTIRFNNIYNFIKVAHALSRRRNAEPVIIEAEATAQLNIVPVDFAVSAIWDISQLPESAGKICHITNPSPPTFTQLVETYRKILHLNIQCIDPREKDNPDILTKGRRIGATFTEYGEYMFGEPEFDLTRSRSLLPDYDDRFPVLNEEYYRKILDFAVSKRWGSRMSINVSAIPVTPRKTHYTERYFREFLVDKLNMQLISNVQNLNGVVAIHFSDQEGPDWILELHDGMLVAISQKSLVPECTYVISTATFEAVARGISRPEQVFFDGNADIKGNIEKGLQVITALAEFFRAFPFTPQDVIAKGKA